MSEQRQAICDSCPAALTRGGQAVQCRRDGRMIAAKLHGVGVCPLGRWEPASPAPRESGEAFANWPWLVRRVAALRAPGDRGLGDTIARHLNSLGAGALKWFHRKLTGRDCGCADRQQRLNALYPYDHES